MWLSTWSLQEFSRRTGKVGCNGDHNYFWKAEMVILLPTFSSARWLEHILKDERSNFKPHMRRGGWAGLVMIYYTIQAHQSSPNCQEPGYATWKFPSALSPCATGSGWESLSARTGSWDAENRSDWDSVKASKKKKNKKITKISHLFCALITRKCVFPSNTCEMSTHRTIDRLVLKWREDI